MSEYKCWMAGSRWASPEAARGQCAAATDEMVRAFPELRRVRGHYYDSCWGAREHWWCVAPDGEIFDPTKMQFPSRGSGKYLPWDEAQPEPTGMCPNCGGYCYDDSYCCSDACAKAYAAYCLGVTG